MTDICGPAGVKKITVRRREPMKACLLPLGAGAYGPTRAANAKDEQRDNKVDDRGEVTVQAPRPSTSFMKTFLLLAAVVLAIFVAGRSAGMDQLQGALSGISSLGYSLIEHAGSFSHRYHATQ